MTCNGQAGEGCTFSKEKMHPSLFVGEQTSGFCRLIEFFSLLNDSLS